MYRLTWRLPLAGLVAFSHLQFSQIRGRQLYLIVRKILYVILLSAGTRGVGALPDGQSALCREAAPHRRHGVVDQKISEHRVAEGPADERCHHRVSQGRVPLSQPKVRKILDTTLAN